MTRSVPRHRDGGEPGLHLHAVHGPIVEGVDVADVGDVEDVPARVPDHHLVHAGLHGAVGALLAEWLTRVERAGR